MSIFRIVMIGLLTTMASTTLADKPTDDKAAKADADADQEKRYQQFEKQLSGVKFVGRFTVLGKEEGPLAKEEYTIQSAKKMPRGDYWLITARIKYGRHDITLPLPLEVKWAADTPVITLTELSIPGLGTFSSRVVIYNKKYAGTWTHGKVGGHLFGTVEKLDTESRSDAASPKPATP